MEERDEKHRETNLLDYLAILNKYKGLIIAFIMVSIIITGIISFLSPKIYMANATIMHVSNEQEQSSITTIASQFGITSPRTSNVAEIMALLNSKILMEKTIQKYDLIPVILGKDLKGKKDSEKMWDSIRYLQQGIFKARENKREGVIRLSAEHKDPEVAAKILTNILSELTSYMSSEAQRVANTNKEYLESLIDKNVDPLIQEKIYSLIARQIEISMMAEVKENFAFKVLDPPKVPDRVISPKIRKNIVMAFILSLFASIFLAFFAEYINNIRNAGSNR